jgi:hypothetical protein
MFHGFNTLPAHIQDTLYILTVEMECQDGAPGMAGVMLFWDILGTCTITPYMLSIIRIRIWVMLRDTSHKNN